MKPGGPAAAVYTLCAMSLGVGVFVLPIVFKVRALAECNESSILRTAAE